MSDEKKIEDINKIKVGRYIIYENEAYRVTNVAHSKTGKHGHAKVRMEAVSLIGSRKINIVKSGGSRMEVPIIDKKTAQVLTLREEFEQRGMESIRKVIVNVMDSESYETFDMTVPKDLEDNVSEGSEVIYWDVMSNKLIQQVKK